MFKGIDVSAHQRRIYWGKSKIEASDGSITATCFEGEPEIAIPIQLKVVR